LPKKLQLMGRSGTRRRWWDDEVGEGSSLPKVTAHEFCMEDGVQQGGRNAWRWGSKQLARQWDSVPECHTSTAPPKPRLQYTTCNL
jgi:hypothetical protein